MEDSRVKKVIIKKSVKIPLFDIDWTLLEGGNKIHNDSFDFAFRTVYNQPTASKKEIVTHGMIDTQIIIEVLKLHGVSKQIAKSKMKQALEAMVDYYNKHCETGNYILMPGVKELLEKLKKHNVPIGLLTGNVMEIAWKKMEKAGIKKYFSFGAFGSMAYNRADLVKIAQKETEKILGLAIPLNRFVIVGDAPGDVICAKVNGIEAIAVATHNYSKQELMVSGADLTVDSLKDQEILKFLKVI